MPTRSKGFTLIEILVAITITVLVLFTIYGTFISVSRARKQVETRSDGYRQARVIFDRIGREIRGAYVLPNNSNTVFAGGVNTQGNPFLQLTTTATTPQSGVETGLALVSYEFRDDPEKPGRKVLMRTETSTFGVADDQASGYRLATDLDGMKLRFYANGTWQDQWQAGVPDIVEVTLTIKIDGVDVPFVSSFDLPKVQSKVPT